MQNDRCLQSVRAFISLGSNTGNSRKKLKEASDAIAGLPQVAIRAASPVYLTEPQGYADQPWFCNQVVLAETGPMWRPASFLSALLAIETALGRQRGPLRFGPRCIDLDLLLFGDVVSVEPDCILPHPRLTRRAFVLVPLADIAPDTLINGKTPVRWLADLDWRLDGCKIFQ